MENTSLEMPQNSSRNMHPKKSIWTPWPIALPTLGTIIGIWRVIGSKPGAVLLILK